MSNQIAAELLQHRRPAAARGRDLERTRERLELWLRDKLGDDVTVSGLDYPVGAGVSNETIFFRMGRTNSSAHDQDLVLRIHPGTRQLFLDPKFDTQFRVLEALGAHSTVRVPRMRWLETDPAVLGAPFFVMDRMEGRVPVSMPVYTMTGWLREASVRQRRTLWEAAMDQLIRINTTPLETVDFLDERKPGQTGFDQLWEYTNDYYEWACNGWPVPILDDARAWLNANLPAERPTGLSWGDARIGNMMFDENFDVVGVMDWEQVGFGGGIQDLAWWLFFDDLHSTCVGLQRLDGLGTRQETIDRWESETKLSASDLYWYEVFAGYKVSVIYVRLMQIGKVAKPADNRSNNFFSRHLCDLLGVPEPADQLEDSATVTTPQPMSD